MNKQWIGYIIIVFLYFVCSIFEPSLDLKYQRELLLGKGEIPFGGIALISAFIFYYVYLEFKK